MAYVFVLSRLRPGDYSTSRSKDYLSNEQLQGGNIASRKTSQASPGAPKFTKRIKEIGKRIRSPLSLFHYPISLCVLRGFVVRTDEGEWMMENRKRMMESGGRLSFPTSRFPPPAREIKGLSKWRNENGFYVARVHYTADPHKDPDTPEGREWYIQARRGMPETSWRKEYEIDWFARSGQLVYPQFKREVHVKEPFRIPDDWTRYMAIDPGLRNPTACLWAAVDKDDTIIFYDEYYVTDQIIRDHCRAIRQREGDDNIFLRLIDPSASGRNMINKRSNKDEFARFKIYCRPANNSLEPGINRVAQYLKRETGNGKRERETGGGKRETDSDTGKPRIYFFSNLTNTIKEITNYRWEEMDTESANKRNPPERPVKRNDHLMDCLRYIIMADPHYVRQIDIPAYKPYTRWDDMTTGY